MHADRLILVFERYRFFICISSTWESHQKSLAFDDWTSKIRKQSGDSQRFVQLEVLEIMFMQFYACFYLFSFIKCMKLSGKLAREDRPIRIMSAYSRSYTVRQEESSCSDMNDWVHFDLLPKWQVLDRIYESTVAHAEQTAWRTWNIKRKERKRRHKHMRAVNSTLVKQRFQFELESGKKEPSVYV